MVEQSIGKGNTGVAVAKHLVCDTDRTMFLPARTYIVILCCLLLTKLFFYRAQRGDSTAEYGILAAKCRVALIMPYLSR